MSEHLSAEQISEWMVGGRSLQLERHLAACAACRAEVEKLEGALAAYRGAVRDWSGSPPPPEWRGPFAGPAWFSWPRAALTAAALAMLLIPPLYWRDRARQRAAEAARADAQLLERVDASIARAVPEPMDPLVNLVAWNSQ